MPVSEKMAVYKTLLPEWLFPALRRGLRLDTAWQQDLAKIRCPSGSNAVELSVFASLDATDPSLYLHLGDTFNSQLIVLMIVVNDTSSPRYNIDRDEQGNPTHLGTSSRNVPEETRAMEAGLAPGQIHRGLRIFRAAVPVFEQFIQRMGHVMFFIEPLFYHNAIIFERYGFAYSRGRREMEAIHHDFQPGNQLHRQLDDSTPFRSQHAWKTVLGRSWAIHDGVLGHAFSGVQMYKRVGGMAHVCTFPDADW